MLTPTAAVDQDMGALSGRGVDQVEIRVHEIVAVDVLVKVDGPIARPSLVAERWLGLLIELTHAQQDTTTVSLLSDLSAE